MSDQSNSFEEKLKGVNFEKAREAIRYMFELGKEEAKRQGSEVYVSKEYHAVLVPFMSDPCYQNAIKLLEVAPILYEFFEKSKSTTDPHTVKNSSEKGRSPVTPEQLSRALFQLFVLDDEVSVRESDLGQYALNSISQDLMFNKCVYFYLVGLVAVALTAEYQNREIIAEVIPSFRNIVSQEALRRWNIFQGEVDESVEEASQALAKLLFTNPKENRALCFEWSREWLAKAGIEQYNPISLWKLGIFWMDRYVILMKSIKVFEIVS